MNYKEFESSSFKFKTCHRDDMYHVIRDNDDTRMFRHVVDIFLIAFSIGFRKGSRKTIGSGSINHVNAVNIKTDKQDLIILLMLNRHKDLEDADALWGAVGEYAEYGIEVLCESLKRCDWILDVDDLMNI